MELFQSLLSLAAILLTMAFSALLLAWRRPFPGTVPLAGALAATAFLELADMMVWSAPDARLFWMRLSLAAEGAAAALWYLTGMVYARKPGSRLFGLPGRRHVAALILFLLLPLAALVPGWIIMGLEMGEGGTILLTRPGLVFHACVLAALVLALVGLEATMVSATHAVRWKIKFTLLGCAAIIAPMTLYYSQALVHGSLDHWLLSLKSLGLILGGCLAAYSRLRREERVRIAVSRQAAYKSLVLFAFGVYLVVFGLLGFWQRILHDWLPVRFPLLVAFAFLGGMLLIILLLSEKFSRRARDLIQRHFYEDKYDYRTQWMRFTERLTGRENPEELFGSVLLGYCDTFGLKGGCLVLRDGAESALAARLEFEPRQTVFDDSSELMRTLARRGGVFAVGEDDAKLREQLADITTGEPARFVVPLGETARPEGVLLLGPPIDEREVYTGEDLDLMTAMAHHVRSSIRNLRLAEELAEAREMELLGRLSSFMAHDLKNLVYTISLVTENARFHMDDPEFQQDMLGTLENTVAKMKVLISQLRNVPEKPALKTAAVDLSQVAREAGDLLGGPDRVRLAGEPVIAEADRDEIFKVALNLILNALEASEESAIVEASTGFDGKPFFRVRDKGCGMDEKFVREDLFRPFRTTKRKGMGIGLYQCRQIVEAHGGKIDVDSSPGGGSTFTVWLPGAEESPAG